MLRFLVFLARFFRPQLLGGSFVPFPDWLRRYMELAGYTRQDMVHVYAQLALGTDFSHLVDNEVACAESVTRLLRGIDPTLTPIITGTYTLYEHFQKSQDFHRVTLPDARPGTVVISPTGLGNGKIRGHVGILGKNNIIYSNNSDSGEWAKDYTFTTWYRRYAEHGSLPIFLYNITNS